MKLETKNKICIAPWTNYTVDNNTVTGCPLLENTFSFQNYFGPWEKQFWLINPAIIAQRKRMINQGTKTCPFSCPFKENVESVHEQLKKYSVDEYSLEICNIIADQIKKGIFDIIVNPLEINISYGSNQVHGCGFISKKENGEEYFKQNPSEENLENIKPIYERCVVFNTFGSDIFQEKDSVIEKMYEPIWNNKLIKIGATTRGIELTLEKYEKFCVNGPINNISLSIDSVSADTYEKIYNSNIEKTINNIEKICEKYKNHVINKILITVSCLNVNEILNVFKFSEKIKAKEIHLNLIKNNNNSILLYPKSKEKKRIMLEDYIKIKQYLLNFQKTSHLKIYGIEQIEIQLRKFQGVEE